jgi:hypothetical protein
MDIIRAKRIGDERDNRQRTPETRIVLEIRATKRSDATLVWLSLPDDASAQPWGEDA